MTTRCGRCGNNPYIHLESCPCTCHTAERVAITALITAEPHAGWPTGPETGSDELEYGSDATTARKRPHARSTQPTAEKGAQR